jgi:tRNA-specific 2-thiouridylase
VVLPCDVHVSVRYRAAPVRARVGETGGRFEVKFAETVYAVVPGQAAVFYDGDEVLGGGTIARATGRAHADSTPLLGEAP